MSHSMITAEDFSRCGKELPADDTSSCVAATKGYGAEGATDYWLIHSVTDITADDSVNQFSQIADQQGAPVYVFDVQIDGDDLQAACMGHVIPRFVANKNRNTIPSV